MSVFEDGFYIRDDWNTAFAEAIEGMRLSENEDEENYAGNYMYMCTSYDGKDWFKNKNTRSYDV